MKKTNYKTFKSVETVINECDKIEQSNVDIDNKYVKIIDLLITNLYAGDTDLSKTIKDAIDREGSSNGVYQYAVGTLIQNAHKQVPEYKGKDERCERIDTFVNLALSKMNLCVAE